MIGAPQSEHVRTTFRVALQKFRKPAGESLFPRPNLGKAFNAKVILKISAFEPLD